MSALGHSRPSQRVLPSGPCPFRPESRLLRLGRRPCAKSGRAVFNKIKQSRRVATATTSSRLVTSHSSNLRQYGSGCPVINPRPNIKDESAVPADQRQPGGTPLGKAIFKATHLEATCTQRCDRFV